MKMIYFFILVLCFSFTGTAQVWEKSADSMGMISRTRADEVLKHFDTIGASKLLYSLDDRYFYLIIKDTPCYKEYYVALDSVGAIEKIHLVKDEVRSKKQRKQKEQYCKLLSEVQPFDFSQYQVGFKTAMPDATYVSGRNSYFVVKDTNGKRYGEYILSTVIAPLPINKNLWTYLIRRLSDETANSYKARD